MTIKINIRIECVKVAGLDRHQFIWVFRGKEGWIFYSEYDTTFFSLGVPFSQVANVEKDSRCTI